MSVILNFIKKYFIYFIIAIISFVLRVINYSFPSNKFAMDEAYYVLDSISILKYGYEVKWTEQYDTESLTSFFFSNSTSTLVPHSYEYAATHPPLGKILGSLGILFFGESNPLGWRIASIIAGTLIVILTMFFAHRLFKNKTVAILSGLFVAIDPLAIAMSRILHLDIFVTLFSLLGFIFTYEYYKNRKNSYLFLVGISFGLAAAVKWSGIYFFAGAIMFIIVALLKHYGLFNALIKAGQAFMLFIITYVFSWSLWFINYGFTHYGFIDSFKKFITMHVDILAQHSSLSYEHPYASKASEWLLSSHSTLLSRELYEEGGLVRAVLSTPNLILWIASCFVFIMTIIIHILKRKMPSKSVMLLIIAISTGWLPWLLFSNRTIFQFYTVAFQPYLYILLSFVIVLYIVKNKRKKNSISRMLALIIIVASLALSFRMYSSAVGLISSTNNSGYAITFQWQEYMVQLGMYDTSQMSKQDRKIYD